jgi:hypothetical protein
MSKKVRQTRIFANVFNDGDLPCRQGNRLFPLDMPIPSGPTRLSFNRVQRSLESHAFKAIATRNRSVRSVKPCTDEGTNVETIPAVAG